MLVWLEFHRPLGQSFVLFFRRSASPEPAYDVRLQAVDPDAQYEVTFAETYEVKEKRLMAGRQLASFRVEIQRAPGSLLLRYRSREGHTRVTDT